MADNLENKAESSRVQLIEGDAPKYHGKYVAFVSFDNRTVVAHGKNPWRVIKKARRRGIENPVIYRVPDSYKRIYIAA